MKYSYFLILLSLSAYAEETRWYCTYKGVVIASHNTEQQCLHECIQGSCNMVTRRPTNWKSINNGDLPTKEQQDNEALLLQQKTNDIEEAKKKAMSRGSNEKGPPSRETYAKLM